MFNILVKCHRQRRLLDSAARVLTEELVENVSHGNSKEAEEAATSNRVKSRSEERKSHSVNELGEKGCKGGWRGSNNHRKRYNAKLR